MFLKFLKKKEKRDVLSGTASIRDGIDVEMMYCPKCRDEYRPTLAECPACGTVLITGEERLEQVTARKNELDSRNMSIDADDSVATIRKGSVVELKSLQKALAAEGIPSLLVNESEQCGRGCCAPEISLQIRETDFDGAADIMSREFIRSTALDTHDLSNAAAVIDVQAAQTTCPACGCRFSPTVGACPDCGLCFE